MPEFWGGEVHSGGGECCFRASDVRAGLGLGSGERRGSRGQAGSWQDWDISEP